MAKNVQMLSIQMKRNTVINHGKNPIAGDGGYKLGVLFYCSRFLKLLSFLRARMSNKIIFKY